MKIINWNQEKNRELIEKRNISFETVTRYIESEDIIDIYTHPNKRKYPNQKIFVIKVEDYIYLVPFIETETEIFLKTIFPSRKATKEYLED